MSRTLSLSPSLVRELFDYNSETGALIWRYHPGKARNYSAGKVAGSLKRSRHSTGVDYLKVHLTMPGHPESQHFIEAHRLAWAHFYGEWPAGQIDHRDGDGLNNAISNLRLANASLNARNRRLGKRNCSGISGVTWHKAAAKWQAGAGVQCPITGRRRFNHLGLHETLLEAAAARKSYERQHSYGPAAGAAAREAAA